MAKEAMGRELKKYSINRKQFSSNNIEFLEEVNITGNDGTTILAGVNAIVIPDDNYPGIVRETAQFRQMLQKVQESEEKYRNLVELFPDAIILHQDGKVVYINKAGAKLFGAEHAEKIIGRSSVDFLHPGSRNKILKKMMQVLTHGKTIKFKDERFILDDGSVREMEVVAGSTIFDGKPAIQVIARDISERIRTRLALEEQKKELKDQLLFAQNLNRLAETIVGTDNNNNILEALTRIIEETLRVSVNIQLLDANELTGFIKRHPNTKNIFWYPFDKIRGSKGLVLYHNNNKKYKDNEQEFINSAVKLVEIAIQKNNYFNELTAALQTLQESEEKCRELIENANDIIYSIDLEGNFLSVNNAGLKTYGYSAEEVPGLNLLQVIHPCYLDECREVIGQELKGVSRTLPYRIPTLTKWGETVWLEVSIHLKMDNGQPIGFQGIARDITERRKMEETIKKSEQEKALILSSLSELVVYYDLNRRIKWVNPAVSEYTGWAAEDILQQNCFERWHKSSTPCPDCFVSKTLKTGEKYRGEVSTPDGSVWFIKTFPAKDEKGNIIGVVEVAQDVTGQRKVEKEMARLDRLNLIGEMAAGFGHEIRNPMATVRGFLQMLGGKNECFPYKHFFQLMIEEMDRANAIITQFLSLAKDKIVDLRLQNMNTIIESLYPLILADAIHNDKSIEMELMDIPELLLDKNEINQLILNLVRNGLEAMLSGGILTIFTLIEDEEIILAVKDQGQGVDPGVLSRLGMPFVTTKEDGTGLGLAICYSIAERHNAKITVETGSAGTTFYVRFKLPLVG